MDGKIKVKGGVPLRGEVIPVSNKNSILAGLPASILTKETVTYTNVPKSTDVLKVIQMLRELGAEVDDSDYGNLQITCKEIKTSRLNHELGNKIRASILFAGPLLARTGRAEIPLPGGCTLGHRSIAAHIDAFQKCGIKCEYDQGYAIFTVKEKTNDFFVWQTEASVTATENIAMYVSGTNSNATIIDAACEPHVVDLLGFLQSIGSSISGVGSNKLQIQGKENLGGGTFNARPDPIDIVGYIVAAAVTDGEITIKNSADIEVVGGIVQWFRKFNISIEINESDLVVKRNGELKIDSERSGFPLAADDLPKFYPRPWPGFPVDALPPVVTLALKTRGKLLINNWMYENGLDFVRELNYLGAKIFISNPQSIIVQGPINFKSGEVQTPDVIQACKAVFLASLCDPVEITLNGVDVLSRRYPDVFTVYRKLGANIENLD